MRYVFAFLALALVAAVSPAAELADAKSACVSVWTGAPGTVGQRYGGSAVVIAAGDTKSLVVTNNHIFSEQHHPEGGFRDDVYPQPATVRAGGKEYGATALAADRTADIAVVLVDAVLAPATVADEPASVGAKVWRSGIGSGYQTGTVTAPENGLERFSITIRGNASVSGDSGAGYFNEANELVGIHCGQDGSGRSRGTSVTFVKTVVTNRAPLRLFPRFRDWLSSRRSVVVPKAAPVPTPVPAPSPVPPATPPKVAPQPTPVPVPTIVYRQVTYVGRFGRRYTVWEPIQTASPNVTAPFGPMPSAGGCPGGVCPAPSRGAIFGR